MQKKSDPFGFDMSVSSAKKKNPRGRRGMSGESETSQRVCAKEGCELPGKFRAPRAPDVLDEYVWFCKDHVREYNLKWNFFNGTTEAHRSGNERAAVQRQSLGARNKAGQRPRGRRLGTPRDRGSASSFGW